MDKNLTKVILILCLSTVLCLSSFAQRQTGSIKGTITDNEKIPLPGCTVTASSDALMGTKSYVTSKTGAYRFPALSPGTYIIVAELPGFATVSRGNIVVRVGMVVTVDITMQMATLEEEITITAASPVVDVEQTKIAVTMDSDLLKNIPLARDLYDIVNAAPGAISEESSLSSLRRTTSIHGGTVRSNTYALDGVNVNDPVVMYPLSNINFDVMDEVEMITAGHPAEVGYTDGAYINVVTRSGGNRFSGGGTVYYTDESLAQYLWTDAQIQALDVAKPEVDKSWIDGSLSFGGPILIDRLWFFSNARYIKQTLKTNFIPYTDPYLGRYHGTYNWIHEEMMGFVKLTSQFSSNIKFMGMFNYVNRYRPMYSEPHPRSIWQATKILDHEKTYTGTGIMTFILNQNTYFDLRFGYINRWFPLPMQEEARDLPRILNQGSLYTQITSSDWNETYIRKRFQTGLYFTRFQDNFIGGNHVIKGGVEFEDAYGDWDWWRKDNLYWYWSKDDPYYYGTTTWKGTPGVGVGRIHFYTCGPEEGSSKIIDRIRRIGAYIQDSITFGERLTLNLGIRFDRSWGWKPAATKAVSGNPVSVYIGEKYVKPYIAARYPDMFPGGFNPFGELSSEEWKDVMVWDAFSPRIGLTYDIFGTGKTALKASFSRYTEYMMIQYFSVIHPLFPKAPRFFWYDMNFNKQVDTGDDFGIYPYDYRIFDLDFAARGLDPDIKSPINDEITVGIWHELFKNFSLGINFIYKDKKNIFEDGIYDPDTGEWWYHIDQPAAQKYWIPFTAIVPSEDYGDRTITFYVRKNDSPDIFYRATNMSEVKRRYWAFELIFNKRMADGWQFSGSVVYSKAYGHMGALFGESLGFSAYGDSPNVFVNTYGRTSMDRPLQIKLMGTARLPFRIFLSAYYRYFSGAPWQPGLGTRSIVIIPPSSWCIEHNAYRDYYGVVLEDQRNPRRLRSRSVLDLRLEKEFVIGDFGRLGAYVDVLNVLGWSDITVGLNDVLYYFPVAENDNTGLVIPTSDYKVINSVDGIRQVKFSIRFSF
ncbi:MAG: carboxypeptidase regulatory-like domain-containing protein [Candidatus Aminicenantaceae bacterium]